MLRANDEPEGKAVARPARWVADGSSDDKKKKKKQRNHKPITANCLLKLLNDAMTRIYISVNNFRKVDRKFLDWFFFFPTFQAAIQFTPMHY